VTRPPDDLLNIFWVEANEYLDALNQILLQLEVASPEDDTTANLREVSRIAHSLKGAARAVGQESIERIAHKMEDLFDLTLDGALTLSPTICDALYDGLDVIQLYSGGGEPEPDTIEAVVQQLVALAGSGDTGSQDGNRSPKHLPEPKRQTVMIRSLAVDQGAHSPSSPPEAPKAIPTLTTAVMRATEDTVRVSLSKLEQLMGQASELLIARMHSESGGRRDRPTSARRAG
jgi:two-component system chemotaxis sensor kinase CheA